MTDRDLRNLYEGVRRGDEYVAPDNIKDLYSQVVQEKYIISYRDESGRDSFEGEVSDTQMMNIKKWIDVSDDAAEQVKAALIRSQFTEDQAEEIMSIVLRHEDPGGFLTAMNAENGKLSMQEFLDNSENLVQYVSHSRGIDVKLVDSLLRFEPVSKPSTGKGEAFLMIFVCPCEKKSGGGDLSIGGVGYEVKGTGARLKGQHGFNSCDAVRKVWISETTSLCKKAGIEIDLPQEDTVYNITKTRSGYFDSLVPSLIQTGKITRDDVISSYTAVFEELYNSSQDRGKLGNNMSDWLESTIDPNGKMLHAEFMDRYFIYALQYYTVVDGFDYLLAIGTNPGKAQRGPAWAYGKCAVISAQDILNDPDLIRTKIAPGAPPSFSSRASTQGAAWSINPVVTSAGRGQFQAWL